MTLTDRLRRTTESNDAAKAMTLTEHLAELRKRVFVIVITLAVTSIVCFFAYNQILHFLQEPYCRANHGNCHLYVTSPLDGISLRIKIAFFGGCFLALPVMLFELWRFITPGLKKKERRYAIPFVVASIILFSAGVLMAYFTFEHALSFLAQIGGPTLQQIYNPNQYLNLILLMMFLFGATFEFPVMLVGLELARVVTPKQLLAWWRWAIISITFASAIFTPSGDPLSMLALAIPLTVFYFLSILIGKIARR